MLRPGAEGTGPSKYGSGIPKLSARKRHGNQVHDEEGLVSAGPPGQRRSGRAAVRGEMSNKIMGDLESSEGPSKLQAFMARKAQGGRGAMPPPVRERSPPRQERQRSLEYLRGGYGRGGGGDKEGCEYDSDYATPLELAAAMQEEHMESAMTNHFAPNLNNQDDDGYDSDADLDHMMTKEHPDYMDVDNHEAVRKTDDGNYIFDHEAMDEMQIQAWKKEGYEFDERPHAIRDRRLDEEDADPITQTYEWDYYFRDICDVTNPLLLKPMKPESNAVLPLKPHGHELDDFMMAVTDHPSKYALIEKKVKHTDSKREPRPIFPKGRKMPDEEFVKKYKGYLFVTGLIPHLDKETGEVMDFNDVLHKQSISESVAKMFEESGINSLDVSPATATSAYIGFVTKLDAKNAMLASADDGRLAVQHTVTLQKYEINADEEIMTDAEKDFVAAVSGGPESILKVNGLPAQTTSAELLQSMFPPGSRLEAMFGPLTTDDYCRISSTSALVNLASSELVSNALKSKNIINNISIVGKRSAQVLRAKRERVFDGWSGVNRSRGKSKLGDRLIVTGDVPPQEMHLSHHATLHLSGLPPNVTLDDLAVFFQPFSADRRDLFGSGHIVRCSQGLPTGCAYVGFELPGEIDEIVELYKDKNVIIGGAEVALLTVSDKKIRRGVRETARPSRSVEELNIDLYDWERHVDPKDIAELEALGIEKEIIQEVMITLRHHNRTFAATDQAIKGERLYEERQAGTHYSDFVKNYLKTLKSCVATRENPGLMYEAMFKQNEEVDTGLFDMEDERIAELRQTGV